MNIELTLLGSNFNGNGNEMKLLGVQEETFFFLPYETGKFLTEGETDFHKSFNFAIVRSWMISCGPRTKDLHIIIWKFIIRSYAMFLWFGYGGCLHWFNLLRYLTNKRPWRVPHPFSDVKFQSSVSSPTRPQTSFNCISLSSHLDSFETVISLLIRPGVFTSLLVGWSNYEDDGKTRKGDNVTRHQHLMSKYEVMCQRLLMWCGGIEHFTSLRQFTFFLYSFTMLLV